MRKCKVSYVTRSRDPRHGNMWMHGAMRNEQERLCFLCARYFLALLCLWYRTNFVLRCPDARIRLHLQRLQEVL